MDGTHDIDLEHAAAAAPADTGALLPRRVRRWVLMAVGILLAATLYLVAVRGTAILFDLRDAVGAMCF